jgi:predicted CXXCH cytochrome family protein
VSTLEPIVVAVALAAALTVAYRLSSSTSRRSRWIPAAAAYAALIGALAWQPKQSVPERALPRGTREGGYASSDTCRSCHPGQYASFYKSYHRSMTQAARPDTVLAPADGATFVIDGHSYELAWRGTKLWARMPDRERRVVMTTGSHHYQGYWVEGSRGNELIKLPFVYHLGQKRFLPRKDIFLQPPDAPQRLTRWNSNCIQCHAVAGRPRHDLSLDEFDSSAVELGIACEACHGPGGAHVERHKNPITRYKQHLSSAPDGIIKNPGKMNARAASEVCGQCHAYFVPRDEESWWQSGYADSHTPGKSLSASRYIFDYERDVGRQEGVLIEASLDSVFWPDGTIRVGGREYNGLVKSPCFERGKGDRTLACTSCHSMHSSEPNDQLRAGMDGNEACFGCHSGFKGRLSLHTRHRADSSGSVCYSCHMPYTSYALFKGIRSHRIDSPNVRQSVATGRPNACNLCHLDRTLAWTRERLRAWYGIESPPLTGDDASVAASLKWLLSGDAAQRVVAAYNMGLPDAQRASGADWQAPFLAELLDDPYSAVRFVAAASLRSLPGFAGLDYDFLEPADRRARTSRLLRARPVHTRREKLPLLLDVAGRVDTIRRQQLLDARDLRAVTIAE